MAAIRVYFDEDVHPFIADALRLRDWEALTTVEAKRRATTDRDQLDFATRNGYALLTYNSRDLPRIHHELIAAGATHAGIIVATQDDPRRTVRAVLNLLNNVTAESLKGNLVYLNNWAETSFRN